MDDPSTPHLKLVHQYPTLFTRVRVDRGAIRFVLSGATLMVPGLTSPGGRVPGDGKDAPVSQNNTSTSSTSTGEGGGVIEKPSISAQADVPEGEVVVVEAEGMENACAVGTLKMGSEKMRTEKKGVGIENAHVVGDGLWKLVLD